MIYELRTYWAAPDKSEALHNRFRTLTLGIFAKHGMQVIGFWTPEADPAENGDLVYIMAFADQEAKARAWDAFRADPEWIAGRAASEKEGTLTVRVKSVTLQATDYSPLK
jgi:NIPSNAP